MHLLFIEQTEYSSPVHILNQIGKYCGQACHDMVLVQFLQHCHHLILHLQPERDKDVKEKRLLCLIEKIEGSLRNHGKIHQLIDACPLHSLVKQTALCMKTQILFYVRLFHFTVFFRHIHLFLTEFIYIVSKTRFFACFQAKSEQYFRNFSLFFLFPASYLSHKFQKGVNIYKWQQ